MTLKTKFKMGESVFVIIYSSKQNTVLCDNCLGQKQQGWSCQKCFNRGSITEWIDHKWCLYDECCPGKIGKITVELYHDNKQHNKYMLDETGIGSGTVWDEDQLFRSQREAELECEKRNKKDGTQNNKDT